MNLLYPGRGAVAHDWLHIASPHGGPVVQLENEKLRCSVLPWAGAGIVELTCKPAGVDVMWLVPDGANYLFSQAHPMAPRQEFVNRWPGGWPELFPTGSAMSDYFGVPQPFHGESVQRRWDHAIVNPGPDEAVARFTLTCASAPLRLTREMILRPGAEEIVLRETVVNLSDLEIPFMWGHHPTYGAPLLAEGTRIELPDCRFHKGDASLLTVPAEGARTGAMFYALDLADGYFGLFNPRLKLGAGIRFDRKLFKVLWVWQDFNSGMRAPLFGRGYATAVEPFTSLPGGMDAHGPSGTAARIAPGATLQTELTAFFYHSPIKG